MIRIIIAWHIFWTYKVHFLFSPPPYCINAFPSTHFMNTLHQKAWLLLCLFIVSMTSYQCEEPDTIVSGDKNFFSAEDQRNIGNTMLEELLSMPNKFPIARKEHHRCAYARVEKLLGSLIQTPEVETRNIFDWDVYIIKNDKVRNAFTLPGGYLFIYSGLIKYARDEAELYAVMANEIAYAEEELTLNALREIYGNLTISDICLGKRVPELKDMLIDLPSMVYDKNAVRAADEFSISLVCPFNYDAYGLPRFLEKADKTQIAWIRSKKGGDMVRRLDDIQESLDACGLEEPTFEQRHQHYLKTCLQ